MSSTPSPSPGRSSVLKTAACDLFEIEYPIVQTGMGWVSGPTLTAATSEAGGLGILAAATLTFEELQQAVIQIKASTTKNFGVNFRPDQDDLTKRVDFIIEQKVKVASFAQAPRQEVVSKLKDHGIVVMPTIGAKRHAEKVLALGVDALIAQGGEGGGHTGSIPTSLLLPDVVDAVDIPVLAAGGFRDGRGLVAAMSYGAAGVAMGTRFLLTQESQIPQAIKARYLKTHVNGTVVTKAIDGYPQRVIRTDFINRLETSTFITRFYRALGYAFAFRKLTGTSLVALLKEGLRMKKNEKLNWSQFIMAANAPMLTRATMVEGREDVGILPTGQVVGCIDELPSVAALINRIVAEAEQTLIRLKV